jgi:ParB/RepB/Spo0J family partition protein
MNTSSSLVRLIQTQPATGEPGFHQVPDPPGGGPVVQLPINQIHEPEGGRAVRQHYDAQALEDLAVSLGLHGLLHPIGVRPLAAERYEVIYGTRRLRAARLAGWTTIAATLRVDLGHAAEMDTSFVLGLAENLQRAQLGGAELAAALRILATLHDHGAQTAQTAQSFEQGHAEQPHSLAGLGRRLGVSQRHRFSLGRRGPCARTARGGQEWSG